MNRYSVSLKDTDTKDLSKHIESSIVNAIIQFLKEDNDEMKELKHYILGKLLEILQSHIVSIPKLKERKVFFGFYTIEHNMDDIEERTQHNTLLLKPIEEIKTEMKRLNSLISPEIDSKTVKNVVKRLRELKKYPLPAEKFTLRDAFYERVSKLVGESYTDDEIKKFSELLAATYKKGENILDKQIHVGLNYFRAAIE